MDNTNLESITDYAKRCGVSRATIHTRINAGEIAVTKIKNVPFIDYVLNPPVGAKKAGRKPASSLLH